MLDKPKSGEPATEIGRNQAELGLEREAERACGQLHFLMRIMPFPGTERLYLEGYTSQAKDVSTRMGPRERYVDDALVFVLGISISPRFLMTH